MAKKPLQVPPAPRCSSVPCSHTPTHAGHCNMVMCANYYADCPISSHKD